MFEWDEVKRLENIQKHLVDFIDAAEIFDNPVIEAIDDRNDYGEVRYNAIGYVNGNYFMVVYTWRKENRRIISAWRLDNDTERRYKKLLSQRNKRDERKGFRED